MQVTSPLAEKLTTQTSVHRFKNTSPQVYLLHTGPHKTGRQQYIQSVVRGLLSVTAQNKSVTTVKQCYHRYKSVTFIKQWYHRHKSVTFIKQCYHMCQLASTVK